MTEEEAKTKWCPMANVTVQSTEGKKGWPLGNRVRPDGNPANIGECFRCIGSACMMWRQGIKRNPDWQPRHQMIAYSPTHLDDEPDPYVMDSERGYCGIAGREGLL